MRRREFDGVLMGDEEGRTWCVYEPRWWQVGRWLRWWWRRAFESRRTVGTVQCSQNVWCEQHDRWDRRTLELRAFLASPARGTFPPGSD